MKSVIVNFRSDSHVDHWWTDFYWSCGDNDTYEKKLEEYNIEVREIEPAMVELMFPNENAYLLFRLRFP